MRGVGRRVSPRRSRVSTPGGLDRFSAVTLLRSIVAGQVVAARGHVDGRKARAYSSRSRDNAAGPKRMGGLRQVVRYNRLLSSGPAAARDDSLAA